MQLSRKALAIEESVTLQIDALAKQMKSDGMDVVGLGAGEPDFDTPKYIRDAAITAMDKGQTRYTPVGGTPDLKAAIIDKLKKDNGLTYTPAEIVVSNGAKHTLFNIMQAILNPGDEVLIASPCWVSYPEMVKMADGVPVIVKGRIENDYKVTADEYRAAVTDKTRAIIICSPNNPNGYVYTGDELRGVAALAVEKDLFVIADEIYEKLVYDGYKHVSIASFDEDIKKRTITVNGVSKSYAMTGWRIGYAACDKAIAKVVTNFQSQSTSNPNSIAQYAAAAAMRGDGTEIDIMAHAFDERRKYLVSRIQSIEGLSCRTPHGAFYIMINVSAVFGKQYNGSPINSAMDFANVLLKEKMVAVVPGEAFMDGDLCRISYATSMDNLIKGMDRIESFIKEMS